MTSCSTGQTATGSPVSMASRLFALAVERLADGVDGFECRGGWAVAGGVVGGGGAEEVEVVGEPASAHADVAAFAEQFVGAEEEAVVDGGALGLVDGGGVAVGDVPGVEVLRREPHLAVGWSRMVMVWWSGSTLVMVARVPLWMPRRRLLRRQTIWSPAW